MKNLPPLCLTFLILASSLIPIIFLSTPARAVNDPVQPPEGGTVYLNAPWNVTDTREYRNCTIIMDGNITIKSGGNLILRNVTVKMNSSSDKKWKIDVWSGGEMHILDWDNDNTTTGDASIITTNNTSYRFIFVVRDGAGFEMRNSEIHRCGGGVAVWVIDPPVPNEAYYGLFIQTDNATIDHNLISYNNYGIVLYGSDALISNNTITQNDDTGIYAGAWSNATIENNWITWSGTYGIWVTGVSNVAPYPWPSNPIIVGNVITDTGRGTQTADGLQVQFNCTPLIKDTVVLRSTEDGLYSSDHSTPTLINVTIDAQNQGNYGISSSSTDYIYIYNSTIINSNIQDFSIADSYFVVTNSTFDTVTITNQWSNLTVRWYLHVFVKDSTDSPIPFADVRIRDNENGTYDRNFTTDSNGYVKWIVLTEYWRNNESIIYYSPYNISVNYTGLTFLDNPRNSTINTSKTEVFTATSPVPEFDSILIPVIIAVVVIISVLRKRRNERRKNERKRT